MDGEDDWDLAAVVRGCCSKAKATVAVPDPFSAPLFNETLSFSVEREQEEEIFLKFFPNIFSSTSRRFEGLEELYTPFLFRHLQRQTEVCSAAAAAAAVDPTSTFCVPKKPQRPACSQAPRSKRRKKQLKKVVCQVPADGVSSDVWAWRKYGQKPIKGSPYPRGYYRCSSFRGCPARKQVERNRSDPGQLIITYTSEHNHPMPARHKFPSAPLSSSSAATDSASAEVRTDNSSSVKETDQLASSPTTSASVDGDDEEMLMVEDMEMIGEDELVFVGDASKETLATEGASLFEDGGEFDDRLFTSPPWLDNSSATAAAC